MTKINLFKKHWCLFPFPSLLKMDVCLNSQTYVISASQKKNTFVVRTLKNQVSQNKYPTSSKDRDLSPSTEVPNPWVADCHWSLAYQELGRTNEGSSICPHVGSRQCVKPHTPGPQKNCPPKNQSLTPKEPCIA